MKVIAEQQENVLREDFYFLKEYYAPEEIMNRVAIKAVPIALRRSALVNTPINYIARRILDKDKNVVSVHSDDGAGNRNRNIALGVIEGIGAILLTKLIKRKFF